MRKNRVRLTESQLHQVIKESVKKVLYENMFDGNTKQKAYDINSKKYKKMFDKGSATDLEQEYGPYADDIKDSESAAQEFLNRPNAAQDFKNFPRQSVRRNNGNYDNLAGGSSRINQYKELSKKRKQAGTTEHFENWLKEQDIIGLDEFYKKTKLYQQLIIARYAQIFNLSRKSVSMNVLGYQEPTEYFFTKDDLDGIY